MSSPPRADLPSTVVITGFDLEARSAAWPYLPGDPTGSAAPVKYRDCQKCIIAALRFEHRVKDGS